MATLIFVLLVLSFFTAVLVAVFAQDVKGLLPQMCLSYVVGGLAMACLYELHKIIGVAQ